MSQYRIGNGGRLYDFTTGELVGWIDSNGQEQLFAGVEASSDGRIVSVPMVLPQAAEFTTSMLVASLVAGATASQSGTTVTIEATGHGVPASKNGSRFYFPGSASIPAGWYDGLTWVSVNTLTFQRPSAVSVAPEQINGGAAFTGAFVKAVSYPIPGGAMGNNGRIRASVLRTGDVGAGTKYVRMLINNIYASVCTGTTFPCGTASMTIWSNQSQTSQIVVASNDGNTGSSFQLLSINTAADFTIGFALSVTNASQWVALDAVDVELVRR